MADYPGMTNGAIRPYPPHIGPAARALSGSGTAFSLDGRTKEARFIRDAERALLDQLGGEPGFAQRVIVRRAAKTMLLAEKLDQRIGSSDCGAQDARTLGDLNSAIRDALSDLGLSHRPPAGGKPKQEPAR